MKKRILLCSDASYLSTGFATYAHELLSYLHATGKFEVAELAAFGDTSDPTDTRWQEVPWKFYPVFYNRAIPGDKERYFSNPTNKYGEWKFEEACLDFKPDIVSSHNDWWALEFQERSPCRKKYHWAIMPTCDSVPQNEDWIATYMGADAVFTYSDWALDVFKKQGGGKIPTVCATPAGADFSSYQFNANKAERRAAKGIDPNALLVGTIMRNQKRKLYPNLFEAFAQFLRSAHPALAQNTYLYLHTSWPDVGWDLPKLMLDFGISHKVLFSYLCGSCGAVFPSFFQDAKGSCRICGKTTAVFPNTTIGVSRKVLAQVYEMFDVYVQYANSEGQGMPQVEAAACGVPVMAVDYSAMGDVVRKLGGTPINVQSFYYEVETGCKRAIPDNADFVDKLSNFLHKPAPVRLNLGWKARQCAVEHYNWEKTCKRWEAHFDSVPSRAAHWSLPADIHQPKPYPDIPLSNEDFVRWGLVHVAGRPDLVNSYLSMRIVRDLNWEATTGRHANNVYRHEQAEQTRDRKLQPFSREMANEMFVALCEQRNMWEQRRVDSLKR